MKKNDYVRISKLSAVVDAKFKSPKMEDYEQGGLNEGTSLPVDYWAEGFLLTDVEIGLPVVMDRRIRNGVSMPGVFNTSPVKKIEGNNVFTGNSQYLVIKDPINQN